MTTQHTMKDAAQMIAVCSMQNIVPSPLCPVGRVLVTALGLGFFVANGNRHWNANRKS